MRRLLSIVLGVVLFGLGTVRGDGDDAEPFFNGKDLTGWEGNPDLWSVKDGAIVGETTGGLKHNTFLCSKRPYKQFALQFQVKLEGGNSGVQIRSKLVDPEKFIVRGPQVDMAPGYWGSLYGEGYTEEKGFGGGGLMKKADAELVKQAITNDRDFIDYDVRCADNHITIKINGVTTVDNDFKVPEEGIIAWQLHAPGPMKVTFRNLRFTTNVTTRPKE